MCCNIDNGASIRMQRRYFMKSAIACSAALAVGATAGIGGAGAAGTVGRPLDNLELALAQALREIAGPACIAAAERLENRDPGGDGFNFHVRGSGIGSADAVRIAKALMSVSPEASVMLRSFSLSYNADLGDAGAIALAGALPPTLRDLGLVGCNIGDAGGLALHEWARTARGLKMICIEHNKISADLKSRFQRLPGIVAYV